MPAAFWFFSVTMPFMYSLSVKGNTSEESSSLIGDTLGHLGFVGHLSSVVDEQLVCNLVSSDQTSWF